MFEKEKEPNQRTEEEEKDKDEKKTTDKDRKKNKEREKNIKRMDKWWRERRAIIEERNERRIESKGIEKEKKPAARSREKGTHMGTPIVRDREHWGARGRHTKEEGTNTTREKQETQGATKPTEGADGTHTPADYQTHTHHPRGGSREGHREGEERSTEGAGTEGHEGRLELERQHRKRKQKLEQPTPPKLQKESDETNRPGAGHPPTQSPLGHSTDPADTGD